MVAGSVTKGTIPDEMHGCNGQKAFPHGQGEENTGAPEPASCWESCPGKSALQKFSNGSQTKGNLL